jgi:glycosyltransferase involved in cell wall biosynthesis
MMSAAHIVPSLMNRASGPAYSVVQLCLALARASCETTLYALDSPPPDFPSELRIRSFPRWPYPYRLGFSPSMRKALREARGAYDVVHNHSLWMMPNLYAAQAVQKGKSRLIISPRGTLSEWAMNHSKWLKKAMWGMGQGRVLHTCDGFHATADSERDDIRRLGFTQPVAVLPNGIEIPERIYPRSGTARTLLFVGRIHPKKGLPFLIKAWSRLERQYPDWRLALIGRDELGHERQLQRQAEQAGCRRIRFQGPLYGEALVRAYQEADLYVLPTHSENFGMTVAESLANGTPVITTKGAPWEGLEKNGGGWWIDIGEEPLTEALRQAMNMNREQLEEKGEKGRGWMNRDYAWTSIAEKMILYYNWLNGMGSVPSFVST